MARYETAAGRAAMFGFAGAVVLESMATPGHGVFSPLAAAGADALAPLAAVALAAVALAAAAGLARTTRPGAGLLELVVSSLTGPSRARGAVSASLLDGGEAAAVDGAVDALLAFVFDADFCAAAGATVQGAEVVVEEGEA